MRMGCALKRTGFSCSSCGLDLVAGVWCACFVVLHIFFVIWLFFGQSDGTWLEGENRAWPRFFFLFFPLFFYFALPHRFIFFQGPSSFYLAPRFCFVLFSFYVFRLIFKMVGLSNRLARWQGERCLFRPLDGERGGNFNFISIAIVFAQKTPLGDNQTQFFSRFVWLLIIIITICVTFAPTGLLREWKRLSRLHAS